MRSRYTQIWAVLLAFFLCFDHFSVVCKRSGIFGSRGGSSRNGYSSGIGRSHYPSSHNGGSGRRSITDRLLGRNKGGGYGGNRNRGVLAGAAGGGLLGHGARKSGGFFGSRGHGGGNKFRSSGIGSRSRAGTFKNMLVGAAGGILAYQAGKAIIKNVARPMMWNNRPYYWGSQYHPSHQGGYGGGYGAAPSKTMCRMPIEPDDPVLGQVYMSDNTRPKEIVWSCEINEECCGYECCPRY